MTPRFRNTIVLWAFCSSAVIVQPVHAAPRGDGQLTIEVVDADTGQPIAGRMHLKNSRGRPVSSRLPTSAEFGGHFYIDGQLTLPLRVGQYMFELETGPEYRTQSGHFEIERHADDSKRIEMKRFANLAEEGWFGGDLDVARQPSDMPLIMRAEGLHLAPIHSTSSKRRNGKQAAGSFTQLVQQSGGELLLFELRSPLGPGLDAADASSLSVRQEARNQDGRVVARVPYAWDIPMWLASGELDAISLIHHHSLRDGTLDKEDDGRPRDRSLFTGRAGNGRWSEKVYFHALNCGLRIPPVAGSGSGVNDNPVGTNRVYVDCGDEFSAASWWGGLEAGRVFVTNGPLLRPLVEGKPPGHVFHFEDHGSLTLEIGLDLATRVPVEYLQIIKNGEVETEARLADWTKQKGRLQPLVFDDSGWFLVRAVTSNERTYQFASSGPYYVEKTGKPRISRRSVQFFLDWIEAAESRIDETAKRNADRESLLAEQQSARQFFEDLLSKANAD
jgi:hypothetical protein